MGGHSTLLYRAHNFARFFALYCASTNYTEGLKHLSDFYVDDKLLNEVDANSKAESKLPTYKKVDCPNIHHN